MFRPSNGRDGGFGGRSFGGRSGGFGGRDSERGPPQMHDAICSKCEKACQVPFRPTGSKPVLCSDCFRQEGGNSRGRSGGNGVSTEQLDKINAKLDKIIKILGELEIDVDDADLDEDEEQPVDGNIKEKAAEPSEEEKE